MKKNRIVTVVMVMVLCMSFFPASPTYMAYADETEETVADLVISNAQELRDFRDSVNSGTTYEGQTVQLSADIDLENEEWTPIGCGDSSGVKNTFSGIFDGAGHVISGIHIEKEESCPSDCAYNNPYVTYCALFGKVDGGSIKNLTVEGAIKYIYYIPENTNYNFHTRYVAGIVCYISKGTVENCISRVNLTVQGGTYVGGIVGISNYTPVTDCINYGTIREGRTEFEGSTYSSGDVGGICGAFNTAFNTQEKYIERCANYGKITSESPRYQIIKLGSGGDTSTQTTVTGDYPSAQVGGIVGAYYNANSKDTPGIIKDCSNKADIYGHMQTAGGIVGWYNGSRYSSYPLLLQNCYNLGNITATADGSAVDLRLNAAGLVGNPDFGRDFVEIKNCYSAGTVSKTSDSTASIGELYTNAAPFVTETDSYGADAINDMQDAFSADVPGESYVEDTSLIQMGYPLLYWEETDSDPEAVRIEFDTEPSDAEVMIYNQWQKASALNPVEAKTYSLTPGWYEYSVSRNGYLTEEERFYVSGADEIQIELEESDERTAMITVTPVVSDLDLIVQDASGENIEPVSADNGVYKYVLRSGQTYEYLASASGYITKDGSFSGSEDLDITLDISSYDENAAEDAYIYGDGNTDKKHVITEGGTYYIGDEAKGILTIDTTDPVTLVGRGIADAITYKDLFIDCNQNGTNLTLREVGISDTANTANLIDFNGTENVLTIEGTCLLDYDHGYTSDNDALIHVPYQGALTIKGSGTLYQYNCTQGAGIGGNTGEVNGDITFDMTGFAFIKGTRQGAVIGAGANTGSVSDTPGNITFLSGTYNLETNSRGAAIGGSAGDSGSSEGTNVYIRGGSININCDYTGSAVGGGGYKYGNDSSGGTVYITGGSLRTYIDKNAASNENGGFNNAAFTEGVNDAVITAKRLNDDGEPVYKCVFDTSDLGDGPYTVKVDDEIYFTGDRHAYAYINETLSKDTNEQISVSRTQDNWISNDETNLYFYLTGEDHTITVGDKVYDVSFDESVLDEDGNVIDNKIYTSGAFTVKKASYEGLLGDVNFNNTVNIIDAQIAYSIANGKYTEEEKYETMKLAADVNEDGKVEALDARAIQYFVHYGKFAG